ncbi:MAG TPA: signal peptidase II [Myxococcales bacterium]|nr:signal peptidase II [Myxococcales bacterium]
MNVRRRLLMVAALLSTTIGCDQATKLLAKSALPNTLPQSFLGDVFRLTYAENRGAFLSLGAALPEWARFWVLNVGVALVLVALLFHALWGRKVDPSQAAAYALVVGGGLGNWLDRVLRGGTVVDFMNLGVGPVRTGVFNVADVAIMAGAAVLLLGGVSLRRRPAPTPEPPAPAPP